MSKAEIYRNCQRLTVRVFSAFIITENTTKQMVIRHGVAVSNSDQECLQVYVKPAQNHNFELVTIIGYVHNLFTEPTFDAIVWA